MPRSNTVVSFCAFLSAMFCCALGFAQPVCVDARLEIREFASAPNIVQPVSAICDQAGRLLVIENHTHFRPEDYDGPETDRILILEDKNSDGLADSFEIYFEGERDSMDLALHPDGAVYLATRRKILRLEDNDHDGRVDESTEIVRLETEGNYPHNGLSGLVFDRNGKLSFGFGENLGVAYTMIGSDGKKLTGEAEGGSTYECDSDGGSLRRVATGYWNTFGQCSDIFGNLFAVDNDPDATPPCRLLHIVEGGNFGYQFRYGRPGTHPLQTWTGELPGTLGMIAGTGEAPCEVIFYKEDGLPKDYVGDLLVASWGDHRIERFRLNRRGASFEADRTVVVQGDATFWPVGIAVAKDGSLFITDWGSKSYPLHKEGKVWHLTARDSRTGANRENARFKDKEVDRVQSLLDSNARQDLSSSKLRSIARNDESVDMRVLAVNLLAERDADVSEFATDTAPLAVQAEAFRFLRTSGVETIRHGLESYDPFVRNAAVHALVRNRQALDVDWFEGPFLQTPGEGVSTALVTSVALACELTNDSPSRTLIPAMLRSSNEDVRFVAARWVADNNLQEHIDDIEAALRLTTNNFRVSMGLIAARRHLQGGKFDQEAMLETLTSILKDSQVDSVKTMAMRAAPVGLLPVETVQQAIAAEDSGLAIEAVYAFLGDTRPEAQTALQNVASDKAKDASLRADALVALDRTARDVESLVSFAQDESAVVRRTALRLLTGERLAPERGAMLLRANSDSTVLLNREELRESLPSKRDLTTWVSNTKGDGNRSNGRRLFHNTRVVQCANCHTVANRGAAIGPELTGIVTQQSKAEVLRSVLHPSERIAPQYQPWIIVDHDGKTRTGYHLATKKLVDTFVDKNGERFEIAHEDIQTRAAAETSIMPKGLIDHLTDEEVRDLLAYLSE